MFDNIMLLTDGYKTSHQPLYPPNTRTIYSYLESRGGQFDHTTFFGLQYILEKRLRGVRVSTYEINRAAHVIGNLMGPGVFNEKGWQHIRTAHGGQLPLEIKAVKEGTTVPVGTPLLTVENTCPECYWLTNYVETLLVQVWYPTTVATYSRECKRTILSHLRHSGTEEDIDFKLHDFGFRGVSSVESAAIGGAAHLVNFKGSDTLPAIDFAETYYRAEDGSVAKSIPASEHSTITAWGKAREVEAYRNMLDKYPTGTIACVSDSYDLDNAVANLWGKELFTEVYSRNGVLIIRPDSGKPREVVTKSVRQAYRSFGGYMNAKGFTVLNPHVRFIQGDGVDIGTIDDVLYALEAQEFSSDNVSFGMGGALLQKLNRDTQKFAMKCSWAEVGGGGMDVYKTPVGDPSKWSKRGRFESQKSLELVFRNGEVMRHQNFADIRALAAL